MPDKPIMSTKEYDQMAKKILEEEPKPMDLETLLDPMALAKRVQYLEEVVGLLAEIISPTMTPPKLYEKLGEVALDPVTHRLL